MSTKKEARHAYVSGVIGMSLGTTSISDEDDDDDADEDHGDDGKAVVDLRFQDASRPSVSESCTSKTV